MDNIPWWVILFGFLVFLVIAIRFFNRPSAANSSSMPMPGSTAAKPVEEEDDECPNCEHVVLKDAKFCGWCGFPLDCLCPSCKADLSKAVKKGFLRWCPYCNTKVATLETADLDYETEDLEYDDE